MAKQAPRRLSRARPRDPALPQQSRRLPRRSLGVGASYLGSGTADGLNGRQHHAQAEIDEVDACDGDRELSGENDTTVQQTVNEFYERDVDRRRLSHQDILPKRYAGHGPLARTR